MKQILYSLEFVLEAQDLSIEVLRDSLKELGRDLEVNPKKFTQDTEFYKIYICTENPHTVFDTCSLYGNLSHIRVNEL